MGARENQLGLKRNDYKGRKSTLCHCEVLEAGTPRLLLRQNRTDTHTGGSALDLRLLQDHGTTHPHEARQIHRSLEPTGWALYSKLPAKADLYQRAHAPTSPSTL